jgi:hypothetical protein
VRFGGVWFTLLVVLALIPWSAARADIFRCLAPDGKTLYSDAPCPRGALRSSNITTAVGACSSSECTAQREQAAGYARERLRSEQELLADLTDRRLRAELDAAAKRAHTDDLMRQQWIEARLATAADETAYAAGYPSSYLYPVYPAVRPCGWRCVGLHPRSHKAASARRTWGTALRLDRR